MDYYWQGYKSCDFSELTGKTIKEIEQKDDEEIKFITTDGDEYIMYHSQDCCECVTIEDIDGDLQELVGSVVLSAYEESGETGEGEYGDSYTWTYYRINGICIRWYGSSNGYYSESVDFVKKEK